MSFRSHPALSPLKSILRPLVRRYRSYIEAQPAARPAAPETPIQEPARTTSHTAVASPAAVAPKLDVSLLLHNCRSAFLRDMPPGAQTVCSAGCAGNWYFEWLERCYGPVASHIGVEYYTPRPAQLPPNVRWIANSVSDMSGVTSQSCDLVFSGQNLEHLWPEEVVGFFLESWRILRPDGHLVIDSPNRSLTAPLNWSHPEHTVELTVAEANKLATLSGFDVVRTRGIWLCRDPRTGRVLPFDPNIQDDWTQPERLIVAAGEPDNSFIWWIEARRSARAPDVEGLRAEMSRIFESAWPERVQRLLVAVGSIERRSDGEWVVCAAGQQGVAIYGPYLPLKAGRYAVTFTLTKEGADPPDPDSVICRCDVTRGPEAEVMVARDLRASEVGQSTQVTLAFELSQLQFAMQFRCISLGGVRLSVRRGIVLAEMV
jgi:SAM-dependent methyltransferase